MNRRQLLFAAALLTASRGTSRVGAMAAKEGLFVVDGQRLAIRTLGEGPTVVFEAGLGNDVSTWSAVAAPIAEFARVVLYDRAGLGRSVPLARRDTPITAAGVASALHTLLGMAEIRPPYVMVGHSLGGLYVQMFGRQYPQEISGVVLLDSASVDAPPELKTLATLVPGTAAYLEEEGMVESNRQVTHAGPFPDVPVTVIAATDHGPIFRQWEPTLMRLQRQLVTLSPQGTLIVAQGSGHDVHVDRPAIVVDAVREMVRHVERGQAARR